MGDWGIMGNYVRFEVEGIGRGGIEGEWEAFGINELWDCMGFVG